MKLPERSFTPGGGTVTVGGRRRAAAAMTQEPDWWMEPRAPMYVHPSQKEQVPPSQTGPTGAHGCRPDLDPSKLSHAIMLCGQGQELLAALSCFSWRPCASSSHHSATFTLAHNSACVHGPPIIKRL